MTKKVKSVLLKVCIGILIAGGTCGALYGISKAVIDAKNKPSDPSVTVTAVGITPDSARVQVGNNMTLEAIVVGTNNPPTTVSWKSDDYSICKVDENGVITGIKVGNATITATSTYDKTKFGTCSVAVVDKSSEPTEDEVIEILNDDEYVIYGRTPTGENEDRVVYNEKTVPLEVKETYIETFENMDQSRILVESVEEHATCTIIDGSNEKSIDGTKALYLESEGNYAGIKFAGLKYTENATYKVSFDYKVIQQSNDFFLQFRSYKGGYDYDSYSPFNGEPNTVLHFEEYYDLGNFTDYKLSLFPRNNPGKVVIDNLEITRIYSRPRLKGTDISNDNSLQVGDTTSFTYSFEDPNGLFSEESTSYFWFSSLSTDGLNSDLISKNIPSITLSSGDNNKYIGVSYKTSSTLSALDEWSGFGRQKNSIETSIISTNTVGGLTPALSRDHTFVNNVPLVEDFESYDPLGSNISFNTSGKKSYVYTQRDDVISGNKSLYVESTGYYDGFKTSGYTILPNKKYTVSFDYKFIEKPSSFYVQFRSKTSNDYDVFTPIDVNSVTENVVYHFSHTFNVLDCSDYYLQMFGNNDAYKAVFDNLSINQSEEQYHDEEPTVNPTSLVNIGDYALETFGDTGHKVLGYDGTQVNKDSTLNSLAYTFTSDGNKEEFMPFSNRLLETGVYALDIDYVVKQKGTGNFYFSIFVNDKVSDSSEIQVTDLTLNTKLHINFQFDVTGKTIDKNLLKVFTYYASGHFEIAIDNVKITKCKTPTEDDPTIYTEVDGGTVQMEDSPYIGKGSYHFKSNGTNQYEKLYIKTLPQLSAGTYRLTFDYCLTSFNTNTMYISAWQLGNICKKELQDFNTTLNTPYKYTLEFTITDKLSFIRIMTGNVSGVMDLYINNLVFTKI